MKIFYLTFFFFIFTSFIYSQDSSRTHPIDRFLDSCMEKDYSTLGMVNCLSEANELWTSEINKYYSLLEVYSDEETFRKFRLSQAEWQKYHDSEIEFINSFYSEIYTKMGGGTIYSLLAASDKTELLRKRALQLKSYYETATGVEK
jgi:uncharacterized protein YecT (DUF1311 family)